MLFAAVLPDGDRTGQHVGADGKDQSGILAASPEGVHGDGGGKRIEPGPAVPLRYGQSVQLERTAGGPAFAIELLRAIPFREFLVQRAPRKGDNLPAQLLLFLGEGEIDDVFLRFGGRSSSLCIRFANVLVRLTLYLVNAFNF